MNKGSYQYNNYVFLAGTYLVVCITVGYRETTGKTD